MDRWTFGEAPLPDVEALAAAIRDLTSTVLALEHPNEEIRRITAEVRAAQTRLAHQLPADLAPRIGPDASPDQRVYVDHSRDVGHLQPVLSRVRAQLRRRPR